jgi:hypothetical protein
MYNTLYMHMININMPSTLVACDLTRLELRALVQVIFTATYNLGPGYDT